MNAKFSEGEVVILQSVTMPQYNGEYIIDKIIHPSEPHICRISGIILENCEEIMGYVFTEALLDLVANDGGETIWAEIALRKRQEPSELSYTELMQTLRSPIYEVN